LPDVLLERVLTSGEQESARRVTSDGRVWVRCTVSASLDDGVWTFGDGDNQWRELALLPPDALRALKDAVRVSGILDAASEYGPSSTVLGASSERWTVDLDGRHNITILRGLPEVHVPAVTQVADALHEALAAADRA
jgi:hypothetical protein